MVLDALTDFYTRTNANVHRGGYTLSHEASEVFEEARSSIATFIGATSDEVIFTKNATESINLVSYSLAKRYLKPGDEIVVTRMEHHANFVPWQRLVEERGCIFKTVLLKPDGTLDIESFKSTLGPKVKLVAFTHCSNILGTINPVKHLAALAKECGALVVVDGAQAVPHLAVDVKDIDCDFYAFSGHKMLGPTGVGVLYGRMSLLEKIDPFLFGGDMISEVTLEATTFNDPPRKFEAGTPNAAQAVGLAAAVRYLNTIGMADVRSHEKGLLSYAFNELEQLGGIAIYGPRDPEMKSGVISFNMEGVHPHDVASVLDTFGVCVRSGDHCGQPLMRELGIRGTLRASVYLYNTRGDIDVMIEGLRKAKKIFG